MLLRWLCSLLFYLLLIVGFCPAFVSALPSVALFYGESPPYDELKLFDILVVDPDQPGVDPSTYHHPGSELFAYVSVGEVQPGRPYFSRIPPEWLRGENREWGSKIIDQSGPEWPRFFVDEVVAPLWKKGYRGFFLDTLDSYQRLALSPEQRRQQEDGLKNLIHDVKLRWPEARLILNRGFEILPDIHADVWMVAAESLFRGWDAASGKFTVVAEQDRRWLDSKLLSVHREFQLPILVIDYLPAGERQLARETAAKIQAAGFISYVTTPALNSVGIGDVEVMPRKVLVLYSSKEAGDIFSAEAVRFLGAPLAYLGLVAEYRPVEEALPEFPLAGRYAGIITWLGDEPAGRRRYSQWLQRQMDHHVPVVMFGSLGVGSEVTVLQRLGLTRINVPAPRDIVVQQLDPMMGFELAPQPNAFGVFPVYLSGEGRALLTLQGRGGVLYTPAAVTPWGGYLLSPYITAEMDGLDSSNRWYVNPLSFLQAALRLDASVPVPDLTTELGRRLLLVHIDGDGFASKAERYGYPFAGKVLLDDVLKRYPLPTTVSVIEGEVGPEGLYPADSPALEAIARDIYALPWVEPASHTYSHPFRWSETQKPGHSADNNALPLKNYRFSLEREISGSAAYINKRLLPPGKQVKILLWSGDCVPTEAALAEADRSGLLNMNGGDTIITRSRSSWTNIAGPGLGRGRHYQVFAPDQNENIYTNLWTGPFYGYERVIETFELTESPYRFKPINIYYHPYSVTKPASLNALIKVYDWALRQPVNPIPVSDYILNVLDFNSFAVGRTAQGYRLRGSSALHTVRLPLVGAAPDMGASSGVAGIAPGPNARYVSLVDGNADIAFSNSGAPELPYIESANARLTRFERSSDGIRFDLQAYQPLSLTLAQAGRCHLYDGNVLLHPARQTPDLFHYELPYHESFSLRLHCGA